MIRYNVATLLRSPVGTTRSYEIAEESFAAEDVQIAALHGKVTFVRLRENLLLQGWLEGQATLECGRCLESYVQPIRMEIEVEFQPSVAILTGEPLPPPEDNSIYMIDGHHVVDLDEAVREQVLLNLPMRPLCKPDCAGLCPVCGKNLNEGSCGGHGEQVDERLAVLAALLTAGQDNEQETTD
jgi:uncharacterized protein